MHEPAPRPSLFVRNGSRQLEHVPKELLDFFDQNMLQLFESERFLIDRMIPI